MSQFITPPAYFSLYKSYKSCGGKRVVFKFRDTHVMTLGKPSTLQSSFAKDGKKEVGCMPIFSLALVLRDSSAMTLRSKDHFLQARDEPTV